jgi:predicted nucleic acid-binding protein
MLFAAVHGSQARTAEGESRMSIEIDRATINKMSLDEVIELAKQVAVERRAAKAAALEAAKPKAVVTLATVNPDVPLERQRDRIVEAQQRLIADEVRRLEAETKHEAWLMARQAAIDFHMEMKLANEEAERRFRRNDPCGYWSKAR